MNMVHDQFKTLVIWGFGVIVLLLIGALITQENRLEKYKQIINGDVMDSSHNDLELLEILGQGECSICDTSEILLVMSTAVNRVRDKRFPNTLSGVLYQDNQFHGMYRRDYVKGNVYISPKVQYCASKIAAQGPVDSTIVGFLYPTKVNNKDWYAKVKDKVVIEGRYHHFLKW